MKIIDLTAEIYDKMPVYPGDPEVRIEEVYSLDKDGYSVSRIQINDHVGTHVETQSHLITGKKLQDEPLERFIGIAAIIDVRTGKVEVEDVKKHEDLVEGCNILILRSGYSQKRQEIDIEDKEKPALSLDTVKWIISKGIKIFGIDAFDFDLSPTYDGHKLFFEKGVLIVEGLVNLEAINSNKVKLYVIPARIRGVASCPCRVFAIEE